MKYLYSQKNPEWANIKIDQTNSIMRDNGCLITACAMVISDFFEREVTPKELVEYLNAHNEFTGDLMNWHGIAQFTSFNLNPRISGKDEVMYQLKQVVLAPVNHWVWWVGDMIFDPLDGKTKSANSYKYTGQVRYLSGKKLNIMSNYEGRIIQNTEAETPEAGQFSFVQDGKRRVITDARAGVACLSVMDKQGEKVFALNSKNYHAIPQGKDF